MFAGIGGAGVKRMPSAHSLMMSKKCVTCHMYKPEKEVEKTTAKALKTGGHSFRPDDRVCLKCHEDPKALAAKWREETASMLEQLKTLLDKAPDRKSKLYKQVKLNYNLIVADDGIGLHNPVYAQALLKYSISSLMSKSAW
jgi:formate-dependent nitrite reductase cytochrome c552 subunit